MFLERLDCSQSLMQWHRGFFLLQMNRNINTIFQYLVMHENSFIQVHVSNTVKKKL